jgi:hypothetical protein
MRFPNTTLSEVLATDESLEDNFWQDAEIPSAGFLKDALTAEMARHDTFPDDLQLARTGHEDIYWALREVAPEIVDRDGAIWLRVTCAVEDGIDGERLREYMARCIQSYTADAWSQWDLQQGPDLYVVSFEPYEHMNRTNCAAPVSLVNSLTIEPDGETEETNMKHISPDDLRHMTNREGLILQGCGGDPREWLDGINELLTKEGILLEGDAFREVSVFEHEGHTNLLFDMEDVQLDVGKLAMWRLQTHGNFGGMWLSDYLELRLGVNTDTPREKQLPDSPIVGANGNIFNILGIAANTLKKHGMKDEAREMRARVMDSGGYDKALGIILEYVHPVSVDDEDEDEEYDEDYGEQEEDEDQDFGMEGLE